MRCQIDVKAANFIRYVEGSAEEKERTMNILMITVRHRGNSLSM